jgi:hypothetical protein
MSVTWAHSPAPEARDYSVLPTGTRFLQANEDPTRPGVALADPFLRPFTGNNEIRVTEMSSNASYNSMQVVVTRSVGSRVNFDANYTWSRALCQVSGDDGLRSMLVGGKTTLAVILPDAARAASRIPTELLAAAFS